MEDNEFLSNTDYNRKMDDFWSSFQLGNKSEWLTLDHPLYNIISHFFQKPGGSRRILHINGEAGSGKSVLLRNLIYKIDATISEGASFPQIFYIDSERKFALNQIKSQISASLQKKLFLSVISDPVSLDAILSQLETKIRLYQGDYLIIDSVSQILKTQLKDVQNYGEWRLSLEDFYQNLISRIVSLAIVNSLNVIFVHHLSYNPELDVNLPYYYSHFQNVQGMWLTLQKAIGSDHNFPWSISCYYQRSLKDHSLKQFGVDFPYFIHNGKIFLNQNPN